MEKTYYFSFGVGHMFRNYLIEVIGKGTNERECYESARNIFCNSFGTKWCEQYKQEEALNIAKKYNYHLMKLNENYTFDGDIYE